MKRQGNEWFSPGNELEFSNMTGSDAKNSGQPIGGREKHAGLGCQKAPAEQIMFNPCHVPEMQKHHGEQTFFCELIGRWVPDRAFPRE